MPPLVIALRFEAKWTLTEGEAKVTSLKGSTIVTIRHRTN